MTIERTQKYTWRPLSCEHRVTWRPKSIEFGDALGGHDGVRLLDDLKEANERRPKGGAPGADTLFTR
jgi:hypothetical protein